MEVKLNLKVIDNGSPENEIDRNCKEAVWNYTGTIQIIFVNLVATVKLKIHKIANLRGSPKSRLPESGSEDVKKAFSKP